jgi:WD40 repeat protein
LLYELLAGRTPFDTRAIAGQPWEAILRVIREEEPPRPSQCVGALSREQLGDLAARRGEPVQILPRRLRGELDWIVLKALEKDRNRRYSDAHSLALDLRRFLAHEPVSAGPPSAAYRARKFVRKHRGAVAGAAAVLGLLIASVVVSAVLAWRADRERQQAQAAQRAELAQRRRAEATSETLRRRVYAADLNLAYEAFRANNFGRARELLERHWPQPGENDLRHWEWRYLWQQCQSDARLALPPHRRPIRSVALSPDGRWVAWGGEEGVLQVWEVATRREVTHLGEDAGDPAIVAFSPRGDQLAASVRKGLVKLWAAGAWTETARLPHDGWVRALAFSPDGAWLACMGDDRRIDLWDLAQTNRIARTSISPLRDTTRGRLAFSPREPWLAVGETDGRIRLLELPTLAERASFPGMGEGITALAFSADGRTLASGCGFNDFSIWLWDADTGALNGKFDGHAGWITDLAFSADGRTLASAAVDQTIRLWDVRRETPESPAVPGRSPALQLKGRTVLRGHQHEVRALALSSNGQTLASGSRAGEILLWDAAPAAPVETTPVASESIRDASFSPDGRTIAAWHWDGGLSLRNTTGLDPPRRLTELGTNHYGVHFSPDGKWLAAGTRVGVIRLLDATTLREARAFHGEEMDRMLPIGFGGEGRIFLGVARVIPQPRCYLWEVVTGRKLTAWPIRAENHQVELSPDGRLVATGDHDGLLQLWDAATGRELKQAPAHRTGIVSVKFSPDNQQLASGSAYGDVTLWDVQTLTPLATLRGQSGSIYSLAFSPDGRRLVTGGNWQHAVQFWDVATRQMVATLPAPGAQHEAVRFSPDGHALLTVNSLGALNHWRAPSFEEIAAKPRE